MSSVYEWIVNVNDLINGIVWGVPILILIGVIGVYYTILLKGIQFTKFGLLFGNTVGKLFKKVKPSPEAKGDITSFQAAMTSVSAIVGSGNIAGVATAIVCGGPGTMFWMIIAALIGMATKYAEIALGMKYRKVLEDGTVEGGAMYYLSDGLKQKWIGIVFSILVIPFAFVISAVVDTNTIASTLQEQFNINSLYTGIVLAILVAIVVFGGVKRVGEVCEWLAPIMGTAYILSGLAIIIFHINMVPEVIVEIIKGAFSPQSISGGAVGSVFVCMRYGVARGMYSNEAGLGTAAMIHCGAKVDHPVEQAMWGPVEVFLDTIIVCTISAFVIIMSGLWSTGEYEGAALTMKAFEKMLPGGFGAYICLGAILLFGFSCLISYYTYAQRASTYLFGKKTQNIIKILWVAFIIIGSMTTLGFVWNLADTFNGLMIIPNLIGLLFLSKEVVKMNKEYFEK